MKLDDKQVSVHKEFYNYLVKKNPSENTKLNLVFQENFLLVPKNFFTTLVI